MKVERLECNASLLEFNYKNNIKKIYSNQTYLVNNQDKISHRT